MMSKGQKLDPCNSNEDFFQNELPKLYSYVTLIRHPLNSLRLLGIMKKTDEISFLPWLRSTERLAHVSPNIPILMSYNMQHHRHAMYLLRANLEDQEKENKKLNFSDNFYLLTGFWENPACLNNSNLFVEFIYEESSKESMLSKCKFLRNVCSKTSEIIICSLIIGTMSYLKLYSFNYLKHDSEQILSMNSVRIVGLINEVRDFKCFNLFQTKNLASETHNIEKEFLKNKNPAKYQHFKTFLKQREQLKSSFITFNLNFSFSLFNAGLHKLITFNLNLPLQMNLFFNDPKIKIARFSPSFLQFENSQKETIVIKVFPQIDNPLISLILTVMSKVLDQKLFDRITSDVLRLCIKFDHINILDENQNSSLNSLITSKSRQEDFDNFVIYLMYLIRASSKTTSEDLGDTGLRFRNMEEFPSKKIKFINERGNNKVKEASNWERLLKTDFHSSQCNNPKIFQKTPIDFPIFDLNNVNLASADSFETHQKEGLTDTPMKSSLYMIDLSTPFELFAQNKLKIFRILHLLYENLKVQASSEQNRLELGFLLFSYMKFMNHESSLAYCDYYLRDNPSLFAKFHQFPGFKRLDNLLNRTYIPYNTPIYQPMEAFLENEVEKDPPNILAWQAELLKFNMGNNVLATKNQSNFQKFPLAFKLSQLVCKIFEKMLGKSKIDRWSQISELLLKNYENLTINTEQYHNFKNFPLIHADIFNPSKEDHKTITKNQLKDLKNITKNYPPQKVFLYLIKKKITPDFISNVNLSLQVIINEVLRHIRLEMPSILTQKLPKLAYLLINRMDIHKNFKLDPQSTNKTKNPKPKSYILSDTVNSIIRGNPSLNVSKNPLSFGFIDAKKASEPSPQNDLIFNEVSRILDVQKPMKIKQKYVENIPEDRLEIDSQGVLLKQCVRRLSSFVGAGAFKFSSHQSFITEILKIPKINLSAILPNELKITLELKDENPNNAVNPLENKANLVLWPEFHNGVSTAVKLSSYAFAMNPHHLRTWIFYQKPETPRYDHGGFLLGLGLLGYLSSFLPTDIYQYLKQSHDATTVGILLGLSASRIGKIDESISKTLCLHIPYLLPPNYDVEISLLVQTAALIGIGLLNLGSCNRLMTEMTLAQIGRKPLNDKCLDRDGYSLAAGYALGLINLAKGSLNPNIKDLELEERLIRFIEGGKPLEPPSSMLTTNFNYENKCSSIKEGKNVNTHVTAPAGLLAVSLIYLKTNNEKISKRITVPNSFTGIENANPNHVLLKTVAKNLIMWDSIHNTTAYIYEQIPELIRFIYERSLKEIHERYCFIYNIEEIDYNTVTLIYVNIIAGCIISMGLKYAGTGDQQAIDTIYDEIAKFRKIKQAKCDLANDPANKSALDQYNQFSILCVSVLSCSLILAGTCDVKLLKLIRVLRKKLQDSGLAHYGFNMALNMALGFLFLGNGNYSFRRDNVALAGLLISIYPHFPNHTNDNKYHLQALRHFYILAIEQRVFYAVDIQGYDIVNVWVEMEFQVGKDILIKEKHQTPVLLQDSKKLVGVEVIDEEFYKVLIKEDNINKAVFVKRKFKKSIEKDIDSKSSLGGQREIEILQNFLETIKCEQIEFDPHTIDFIMSGKNSQNQPKGALIRKIHSEYREWFSRRKVIERNLTGEVMPQLIKEDRLEFAEAFFILNRNFKDLSQLSSEFIMNLHVLSQFYNNTQLFGKTCEMSEVFNSSQLKKIGEDLHNFFNLSELLKSNNFIHYFDKPDLALLLVFNPQNPEKLEEITKFCLVYQIPNKKNILMIKKFIVNLWNKFKQNCIQMNQKFSPETIQKSLLNLTGVAGLMKLPLCNHQVLLKICDEIYLKRLI